MNTHYSKTEKTFSLDRFFLKVICVLCLVLLVIVSYRADVVDEWTSDIKNQVKIFLACTLVLGVFPVRWFIKKIKE